MAIIVGPNTATVTMEAGYTTVPQTYVSYNWAVQGGTILYGQGTPVVTIQWDSAGQNTLTVQLGDAQGNPDSISIVIDVASQGGGGK